jgi:hypothetical protein
VADGYWLKPPAALISLAGQSSPLSFLAFFLAHCSGIRLRHLPSP